MTLPDRWKEISALYAEALERPDVERAAFVVGACGHDEGLRQQLQSLLDCHHDAQRILTSTAADILAEDMVAEAVSVVGRQLGAYRIDAPLATGGMGEVYRATDLRLHRPVAIKILPQHLREDVALRQRFEHEAQALAALRHPHVCVLHDVGQADGIDFLVLELLEGETLAEWLARGPLPLPDALRFATEIADALVAIHRQGIVHRDLKPGNVMLTDTGAKLLDFGLARRRALGHVSFPLHANARPAAGSIGATATAGTLCYMAPEQVRGDEIDHRADIFAFGALMWEMITGRKAFDAPTREAAAAAVLHGTPAVLADMPRGLASFLLRCLEKDSSRRWQTADEMMRALRAAARIHDVSREPASSRFVPFGIAAAIAIAALFLLVTVPRTGGGRPDETSPGPANGPGIAGLTRLETSLDRATSGAPASDRPGTPAVTRAAGSPDAATADTVASMAARQVAASRVDEEAGAVVTPDEGVSQSTPGVPEPGRARPSATANGTYGNLGAIVGRETGAVWIHFSVFDRANRHVAGLQSKNVDVREDGVSRGVAMFLAQRPPTALSLVVDRSARTVDALPAVKQAVTGFVGRLAVDDLAQVIDFSERVAVGQFTSSRDDVEQAVHAVQSGGSVALRDAISAALQEHQRLHASDSQAVRRSAIVVYSNGEDTASLVSESELIDRARRANAAVYVLAVSPSGPSADRRDVETLRQLANDTGGEVFLVSRDEVESAYRWISRDLANQYSVAFYSADKGAKSAYRQLEVRLSRPDAVARSRRVIYAPVSR